MTQYLWDGGQDPSVCFYHKQMFVKDVYPEPTMKGSPSRRVEENLTLLTVTTLGRSNPVILLPRESKINFIMTTVRSVLIVLVSPSMFLVFYRVIKQRR